MGGPNQKLHVVFLVIFLEMEIIVLSLFINYVLLFKDMDFEVLLEIAYSDT